MDVSAFEASAADGDGGGPTRSELLDLLRGDHDLLVATAIAVVKVVVRLGLLVVALTLCVLLYLFTIAWLCLFWLQTRLFTISASLLEDCMKGPSALHHSQERDNGRAEQQDGSAIDATKHRDHEPNVAAAPSFAQLRGDSPKQQHQQKRQHENALLLPTTDTIVDHHVLQRDLLDFSSGDRDENTEPQILADEEKSEIHAQKSVASIDQQESGEQATNVNVASRPPDAALSPPTDRDEIGQKDTHHDKIDEGRGSDHYVQSTQPGAASYIHNAFEKGEMVLEQMTRPETGSSHFSPQLSTSKRGRRHVEEPSPGVVDERHKTSGNASEQLAGARNSRREAMRKGRWIGYGIDIVSLSTPRGRATERVSPVALSHTRGSSPTTSDHGHHGYDDHDDDDDNDDSDNGHHGDDEEDDYDEGDEDEEDYERSSPEPLYDNSAFFGASRRSTRQLDSSSPRELQQDEHASPGKESEPVSGTTTSVTLCDVELPVREADATKQVVPPGLDLSDMLRPLKPTLALAVAEDAQAPQYEDRSGPGHSSASAASHLDAEPLHGTVRRDSQFTAQEQTSGKFTSYSDEVLEFTAEGRSFFFDDESDTTTDQLIDVGELVMQQDQDATDETRTGSAGLYLNDLRELDGDVPSDSTSSVSETTPQRHHDFLIHGLFVATDSSFSKQKDSTTNMPPGLGEARPERQATFDALVSSRTVTDSSTSSEVDEVSEILSSPSRSHRVPDEEEASIHLSPFDAQAHEVVTELVMHTKNVSRASKPVDISPMQYHVTRPAQYWTIGTDQSTIDTAAEQLEQGERKAAASSKNPAATAIDEATSTTDVATAEPTEVVIGTDQTKKAFREQKQAAREAVREAWGDREVLRLRILGTWSAENGRALATATRIYEEKRVALAALMATGELNPEDARTFPRFSEVNTASPKVRPEGTNGLLRDRKAKMKQQRSHALDDASTSQGAAASTAQVGHEPPTDIDSLRQRLVTAQEVLQWVENDQKRERPELDEFEAIWAEDEETDIERATRFYRNTRVALLAACGGTMTAEDQDMFPKI